MKIENLKSGMTIKSYPALCKILEIKATRGNVMKRNIENLERFVVFHKEGNKFVIDNIIENPIEKIDARTLKTVDYIPDIEILIMDILVRQEKDNHMIMNHLYSVCGLFCNTHWH